MGTPAAKHNIIMRQRSGESKIKKVASIRTNKNYRECGEL